jgi:ABC-type polar amino acid transport system ATPase subunit
LPERPVGDSPLAADGMTVIVATHEMGFGARVFLERRFRETRRAALNLRQTGRARASSLT